MFLFGSVESDGKPTEKKPKQEAVGDSLAVGKKKRDRFNGMSEDEVLQKHLPDHLAPNLDILIVSGQIHDCILSGK